MIILIEIAFALIFLIFLVKAIIETVWGVILMIYAILLMACGYTLKFVACIMRVFGY